MKTYTKPSSYFPVPQREFELWRTKGSRKVGSSKYSKRKRITTMHTYWNSYVTACKVLHRQGRFDPELAPAERWSTDNVKALLGAPRKDGKTQYSSHSLWNMLVHTERVLLVVDSGGAAPAIARQYKRIKKVRSREPELVHPDELFALGVAAMVKAREAAGGRWDKYGSRAPRHPFLNRYEALFRTGLQVASLAELALRLRTLSLTDTPRNVFKLSEQNKRLWINYAPEHMKIPRVYDRSVPERLAPWLQEYMDHVRPLLCNSGYQGDGLWVTLRGTKQSPGNIRKNVKQLTKEQFGGIPTHWFRHSVATFSALEEPWDTSKASWKLANEYDTMNFRYNKAGKGSARAEVMRRLRTAMQQR